MRLSVIHLITGLSTGGAEIMLYKLLTKLDRVAFDAEVISLTDIGTVGKKIQGLDVRVQALGMRQGRPNLRGMLQLTRWLRRNPPHVIQTWMYHADLMGGVTGRLAGRIPVAWGIRHSNLDPQGNKRSTIWTARACARLSRWLPSRIVCCSEASRWVHTQLGYAADKMVVIRNGIDLDTFRPDPSARLSVRREFRIPDGALLIGLIGRLHPQKDHHNFVQAAASLHAHLPDVHFLLCGEGVSWANLKLAGWIEDAGIQDRCHLLGLRDDIPRLTASLDIASSSSYSEGFPNVIGEAMACGVPCVVTNAGDSALIVGDTGRVVPPKDRQALAMAWRELIEIGPEGRTQLGLSARRRIEENFSLPTVVARYEGLYAELAGYVRS